MVELGGIETAKAVMKKHLGNPSIIVETSRLMTRLAETEEFAEKITDQGILELTLKYCTTNPANCTVPGLDIINQV